MHLGFYSILFMFLIFINACLPNKSENKNFETEYTDSTFIQKKVRNDSTFINKFTLDKKLIKEQKGTYTDNLFNGIKIKYHDNGKVSSITEYYRDKKHGVFQLFHKNGQPKLKANYIQNEPHGEVINYHVEGAAIEFKHFMEGQQIYKKFFSGNDTIEYIYPSIQITPDSIKPGDTFNIRFVFNFEFIDTVGYDFHLAFTSMHSISEDQLDSLYMFDPSYDTKIKNGEVNHRYLAEIGNNNRNVVYGYPYMINRTNGEIVFHPYFRRIFYVY